MNASESSLSKRLAGPSTHKAGLDSVNQELVNKVRTSFDASYRLMQTLRSSMKHLKYIAMSTISYKLTQKREANTLRTSDERMRNSLSKLITC